MSRITTITLPTARHLQLKRIAALKGLTVSAYLETVINREIENGTIEDILPGFDIEQSADVVHINLDGCALPELDPVWAKTVANYIETLAIHRGRDRHQLIKFSETASLHLARVGRGVVAKVKDQEAGTSALVAMTENMALDLVRQLRSAANRAQEAKAA